MYVFLTVEIFYHFTKEPTSVVTIHIFFVLQCISMEVKNFD